MRSVQWILILAFSLSAAVGVQRWIDGKKGSASAVEESLYFTSGATLRQTSLGFEGLMADLYWLRTIQYFGGKIEDKEGTLNIANVGSWKLVLLEPLINITTQLDPQYVAAYRFGSVFIPDIDPAKAIKLAERAIQDNPHDWRLYQDLGFIYWKQKCFQEASDTYLTGSKISEAPKWLEQLSATMLAKGGDRETARQMFTKLYESTDDPNIKKNSLSRLEFYQAADQIDFLNKQLEEFRAARGSCPTHPSQLIRDLPPNVVQKLRQYGMQFDQNMTPLDPHGFAYTLFTVSCKVEIAADSTITQWKD